MGIGFAKGDCTATLLTRTLPIAALVILPACADRPEHGNPETERVQADGPLEVAPKTNNYDQRFSLEELPERHMLGEAEVRDILKDNVIPLGGEGPIYESLYLQSDGNPVVREGGGRSAQIRFKPAQFVGSEICDIPIEKERCRAIWKAGDGLYSSYGPDPQMFVKLNVRPLEINERPVK